MGWDHEQGTGYCRFYEWNDGHGFDTGPIDSRCGSDAGGTTRFYKVEETYNPDTRVYYYSDYDCGTSGWSNCTDLSQGPSISDLGSVNSPVASETNYGGTACTDELMGSSSKTTLYGGGSEPIKGQKSFGGTYSTRPLVYIGPVCSDYRSPTHSDSTFEVYDSRN